MVLDSLSFAADCARSEQPAGGEAVRRRLLRGASVRAADPVGRLLLPRLEEAPPPQWVALTLASGSVVSQ